MAKLQLKEKETVLKETATDEKKPMDPMTKFDSNYKADKLNELYDWYDKMASEEDADIETATPNIVQKHIEKTKARKMSFGQKLSIGVGSAVVALLMFLAIFNIFVINDTTKSIKLANEEMTQTEVNLGEIMDELNQAKKNNDWYEKVKKEYTSESTAGIILGGLDKVVVPVTKTTTNWFDKLCNFLSNIFGG